jgi:Tfp pilus assembly protein PilX
MDNKLKPGRLLKTLFSIRSSNRQRGALLMVLIVAMVIISSLGLGIIYIFSSSNLNPISGNYAQRAYLNAESGFRYLTALYRVDGNQSLFNVTYQNLSLPSGGTVTVSATTPNDEATATATVTGSTLNLTILSGTSFPAAPGIFKIGNTSYR